MEIAIIIFASTVIAATRGRPESGQDYDRGDFQNAHYDFGDHNDDAAFEDHNEEKVMDYSDKARYHYDYSVNELHTHDIKSQWETRNGDKVEGEYIVVQPDGSKRVVKYTADKHTGFQAVVTIIPNGLGEQD
ncbi:adult-specific cuticular protein ACP-20-like isoform X2 [Cylas formicarius]|uniref:adult-specific cuticular protein ACP-20-like isoform X2 n=1 Tax=Cylas formicarius TaxID=197179 RepID=UPI00295864FB|nr:adult-specific cuticular protein ACP-20-like isoform X2 [Cylas formicarius]